MPSGLHLVGLSTGQWPKNTPPGCVRAIWPRRVMECCIRWPGLHNHLTLTQLRWFGMSWIAESRKTADKCSAYMGTLSRLLEKHSSWSWLRECQECAKLSSRQRVVTLKNLKSKIYLKSFNIFFGYYIIPYVLLHSFDVFTIILQCRK